MGQGPYNLLPETLVRGPSSPPVLSGSFPSEGNGTRTRGTLLYRRTYRPAGAVHEIEGGRILDPC